MVTILVTMSRLTPYFLRCAFPDDQCGFNGQEPMSSAAGRWAPHISSIFGLECHRPAISSSLSAPSGRMGTRADRVEGIQGLCRS